MHKTSPANLFQSAVLHYQHRQLEQAEQLCRQLLQLMPNSAETMHLLALCLFSKSPVQAEQLLVQATLIAPSSTIYQKAYANFLLANARYQQALPIYLKLHTVVPTDLEVLYGLAFSQYQQQHFRSALNSIAKAKFSSNNNEKWYVLHTRALLACDETDQALTIINKALNYNSLHNGLRETQVLALRQLQQPNQALVHAQQLPSTPVKSYLIGCLHYDMQHYDIAEQYLRQALAMQPDYIDAHNALNKLYVEHNNTSQFLNSFANALAIAPNSIAIYLSYISHLLMAEQIEQALVVTKQAILKCGEQHPLLHALGTLYYKQQDREQALQLYKQALALAPNNVRYSLDFANLLIKSQHYDEAIQLLTKAKQAEPDNQEVWAYLSLCWRLTDNPKHQWLNDYANLISVKKLPTPAGYANFTDFWHELKTAVNTLHITEHQPLDQSVRNGTQTMGFLFNSKIAVIQTYKALLTEHVKHYLAALAQDSEHPLLRRNINAFRFSGSWSVKLQAEGFHTNHVHPQGWLSVCTYLQVPTAVTTTDPLQQGWLKLGETSLELANRENIDHAICPEEGLCVIFPSYVWHGTLPFSSDETRITLPCDIVPDL